MTASEDFHRPRFHYQPAKNWMNDPNGLIQWQGRVHMFYQYNPAGALSGRIHWGHAVSDDLLHWQELPLALSPLDEGPDAQGCWSGCAVDDGGTPTLVYTGVHPQMVCLATGPGDLAHFRQHPANPVIAGPPPELAEAAHGDFRDPYLWRAGDGWQMVIGTTLGPGGGAVLLYNSADLVHWDYQGILHRGNPNGPEPWNMNVWECPNFIEVDGQHVLMVSTYRPELGIAYPVYYAGQFDGHTFSPSVNQPLTYGSTFYAPQAMRLADGRVVMWGWLRERRPDAALVAAGWAGAMSVPMTLNHLPDGRVRVAPAEELKSLRGAHRGSEGLNLSAGAIGVTLPAAGDCLEVEAVFEPEPGAVFGLAFRRAADASGAEGGADETRLVYDARHGRLEIEASPSSLAAGLKPGLDWAPVALEDGRLRLRAFLDRSMLEVFANDAICLCARHYPARPDSLGLAAFCRAGRARLASLDVWDIAATQRIET
jgi:beta-fructofuranosidase